MQQDRSNHQPEVNAVCAGPTPESGRNPGAILARARTLVDPVLRDWVDRLPPSMRQVAGYHFGWWDEHARPVTANTGKAVRPALAFSCAEAVGGNARAALPPAVAVELAHNFSLLHDDVLDEDTRRRHRPTAWSVFGRPAAILAGDSLLVLAMQVLAQAPSPRAREGACWLHSVLLDLAESENADVSFARRDSVTLPECIAMTAGKTGSLLGCACALGALFGGADARRAAALRRFGEHLGLAFQLMDDLAGIWGDPEATGKPALSDLRNRKKSLPVVAALCSGHPAGVELARLYRREEELDPQGLERAARLIEEAGGRHWAQTEARRRMEGALACLASAGPERGPAEELRALAHLIVRSDN